MPNPFEKSSEPAAVPSSKQSFFHAWLTCPMSAWPFRKWRWVTASPFLSFLLPSHCSQRVPWFAQSAPQPDLGSVQQGLLSFGGGGAWCSCQTCTRAGLGHCRCVEAKLLSSRSGGGTAGRSENGPRGPRQEQRLPWSLSTTVRFVRSEAVGCLSLRLSLPTGCSSARSQEGGALRKGPSAAPCQSTPHPHPHFSASFAGDDVGGWGSSGVKWAFPARATLTVLDLHRLGGPWRLARLAWAGGPPCLCAGVAWVAGLRLLPPPPPGLHFQFGGGLCRRTRRIYWTHTFFLVRLSGDCW